MGAPPSRRGARTLGARRMTAHHATGLADDTLVEHWTRRVKTDLLRAARLASWAAEPGAYPAPVLARAGAHDAVLLAEHRVPLGRTDDAAEPLFEEGKRVNLALAAPAFDGLLLGPDRPLSFWRTLGRATAARGFRYGMELRGGCILPALGGGVCLLSNALFEVAARLGFRVLERHGHSLEAVPPREGEAWGLDATVFWPYVDLRVAPPRPMQLDVRVDDDALVIRVRSDRLLDAAWELVTLDDRVERLDTGTWRSNRIGRRRVGASGPVEVIADNRRRVLAPVEQRRSCLTCGELDCRARVVPRGVTP